MKVAILFPSGSGDGESGKALNGSAGLRTRRAFGVKYLYPLAAASVAAFFLSLTALVWLYGPRLLIHADGVLTRAEGVEGKINATATNLDKASKQWADSEKAISSDVADTMLQARGTLSGATDAFASIPPVAQHLQGTADAGTALLASAKDTTDQLPVTLAHMTADFDATQAPIAAFGQDATDMDAFLKSQAITGTAENAEKITAHLAGITADGQKVADKLTDDFTAKKPWYKKIGPPIEDLWDYGALVARHTP